jgi:hypothetical protein
MLFSHTAYIGIDLTAGRTPFTFAALDTECNLLSLANGGLDDVLTFVSSFQSAIVAVNAPSSLVRAGTRKRPAKQTPTSVAEMRAAERDLRERGILSSRASAVDPSSVRARLGKSLYDGLREAGFVLHPDDGATHLWLETNPQACFTVLLGQKPLSRLTLEGRLQRQIILQDAGLWIKDPMDFFEELTRHRLKMGILPLEQLYTANQLDALVLAYTAWMVMKLPNETTRVGSNDDGFIVLPVGELMEKY